MSATLQVLVYITFLLQTLTVLHAKPCLICLFYRRFVHEAAQSEPFTVSRFPLQSETTRQAFLVPCHKMPMPFCLMLEPVARYLSFCEILFRFHAGSFAPMSTAHILLVAVPFVAEKRLRFWNVFLHHMHLCSVIMNLNIQSLTIWRNKFRLFRIRYIFLRVFAAPVRIRKSGQVLRI